MILLKKKRILKKLGEAVFFLCSTLYHDARISVMVHFTAKGKGNSMLHTRQKYNKKSRVYMKDITFF